MPDRILRRLSSYKPVVPLRYIVSLVAGNTVAVISIFFGTYILIAWAIPSGAVAKSFSKPPDLFSAAWAGLVATVGLIRLCAALSSEIRVQVVSSLVSVCLWGVLAALVAAHNLTDIGVPFFVVFTIADVHTAMTLAHLRITGDRVDLEASVEVVGDSEGPV